MVSAEDGRIYFYNIKTLTCFGMIKLKEGNYASTLEFARDGSSIIAGTNKGTIFTITCLSWDTFSNLQY